LIKNLGLQFNMNPLLMEDILNTEHRPKLEHFEEHLLIIVKMLFLLPQSNHLQAEQLSMLLGKNILITFQEKVGDVFESVRDRLRRKSGKIRSRGVDYLTYALLDTVVDNYSYIIDNLGEKIEQTEELMQDPDKELLEDIYKFKREILFYRKSIRPVKEMIIQFHQSDSGIVSKSTLPFIKDLQDLVGHVFESVEAYHDMLTDQISMYQTTVSNRMNEVMKVLTIFAAIFIPLTFLAGVYGMNFDNIPELHYKYSYYILWSIFIGVFLAMVFYFRKKKWL
ncbi:magnesium/cobalt transporter CorA, partial [Bacteroidota bacterium]